MKIHTQTIIGMFFGFLVGLSLPLPGGNLDASLGTTVKPRMIVGSCTEQGNGTDACNGCLINVCRRSTPKQALTECQRSCAGVATTHLAGNDTCLNQGNAGTACKDCLKNACRSASAEHAMLVCERSCRTGDVREDPACQQQGNGSVRCATCLEDRCSKHSKNQALYLCRLRCT
ncbi:MAG TPA: hypothetical protein VI873_01400 [Candidatus Peribacteraceae bacterium]|nr:hypothetical protein [Candidatus Peribacteraceae bacterium]